VEFLFGNDVKRISYLKKKKEILNILTFLSLLWEFSRTLSSLGIEWAFESRILSEMCLCFFNHPMVKWCNDSCLATDEGKTEMVFRISGM